MIRFSRYFNQNKTLDRIGLKASSFRAAASRSSKRVFDFIAALIGLILLSPLFLFIAALIKRDSPGPVFYWGPRIGRNGTIFRMLKFRTMYENARSYQGARVTAKDDDRVTPVGKWLRDTKLNELPQLWNVLIGEMSLVGPRPEDPTLEKNWPEEIAREVLSVLPGMTSPASVLYRNEENMLAAGDALLKYLHELAPDKMRLDQLYVRYRSFWLDLDVILWTILLLIPRMRAYSLPELFLFSGPVTRLIQRYVSWFLWDLLIVFTSISFTGSLVRLFGPLNIGLWNAIRMAFTFSMICSLVGILLNLNRINWSKATPWNSLRLWLSWTVVTAAALIFHHFYLGAGLAVCSVIVGASLLSLAGVIFIRYQDRLLSGFITRLLLQRVNGRALREHVLVVGSGRTAEHVAWLMDHPAYAGKFQVIGFIDDDIMAQGTEIYGAKVIGRMEDIQTIVKEHDIGLIFLADSQMAARKRQEFRELVDHNPARVVFVPDIFGSLSDLGGTSTNDGVADDLADFQCQYCIARHSGHHERTQA